MQKKTIMKKIINPFIVLPLLLVIGLTACTNYGKKIKVEGTKGEIYYKGDGVTENDAKKVGDFLKNDGFLDNEKAASLQVTKEGETYIVRFVYDKAYFDKTAGLEDFFKIYTAKMSKNVFDGKKVNIVLSDKQFKDFKTIPYDEAAAKTLETPVTDNTALNKEDFDHDSQGGVTFYWKGISDEESRTIADYIVKNGAFAGGTAEIYITKDGDRYLLRFPVKKEFRNDASIIAEIEKVSKEIKENVFPNNPYSFQMTDEQLNPLKSFDY
jgi:hypothetical protein